MEASFNRLKEVYLEREVPALCQHLGQLLGRPLDINVDWASLGTNREALWYLRLRVFNRLRSALTLLADDEAIKADLAEQLSCISIRHVATPDEKHLELEDGILNVAVCLEGGGSGSFTEIEIRDRLAASLHATHVHPAWEAYYRGRFTRIVEGYRQILGDHLKLTVDWAGLPYSGQAQDRTDWMLVGLLRDLRYIASDPDDWWILHQGIRRVHFKHAHTADQKGCRLVEGTLEVTVDLDTGKHGSFTKDELEDFLDKALGLHAQRLLGYVQYDLLLKARLRFQATLSADLTVDWERLSARAFPDEATWKDALRQLTEQVKALTWWLSTLSEEDPVRDQAVERVRAFLLEAVPPTEGRELLSDEGVIHCRFGSTSDAQGRFNVDELCDLLPGVLAGMPAPPEKSLSQSPLLPVQDTDAAQQILAYYRDKEFPLHVARLRYLIDAPLAVEIDWDSFNANPYAAKRLRQYGLPDVFNALKSLVPDRELPPELDGSTVLDDWVPDMKLGFVKGPDTLQADLLRDGLKGITLRQTSPTETPTCTFEAGILHLSAHVDRGRSVDHKDIARVLNHGLGLSIASTIRALRDETLPGYVPRFRKVLGKDASIDVDWDSFRRGDDIKANEGALRRLEDDGFEPMEYALRHLDEHDAALARRYLHGLRYEHARGIKQTELFVDGDVLVCRLYLYPYPTWEGVVDGVWTRTDVSEPGVPKDFRGYFNIDALEALLPGLLASLPGLLDTPWLRAWDTASAGGGDLDGFQQTALPVLQRFLQEAAQTDLTLHIDWDSLDASAGAARTLCVRGLYRVLGALRLLSQDPYWGEVAPDGLAGIVIRDVKTLGHQHCLLSEGTLHLGLALSFGRVGYFAEHEIVRIVREGLGLDTLPLIRNLIENDIPWIQNRLGEALDVEIDIEVDWEGLLDHPESGRRRWALSQLDEVGCRRLYYALSALYDKDPRFKQHVIRRVQTLRFEHVPSTDEKDLLAHKSTLIYRLYLHEGYDGSLGLGELKERLPGVVRFMPNLANRPTRSSLLAQRALDAFRQERLPELLATLHEDLEIVFSVEIDWDSLPTDPELGSHLERYVLDPLKDVFSDALIQPSLTEAIHLIQIVHVDKASRRSLHLEDGVLHLRVSLLDPYEGCFDENELEDYLRENLDLKDEIPREEQEEELALATQLMRDTGIPTFESYFAEQLKIPLTIDIDMTGFESETHLGPRTRTLYQIWHEGFVGLYTAIVTLLISDPGFPARARASFKILRFEAADGAGQKALWRVGDTLLYKYPYPEGNEAYFTSDELISLLLQAVDSPAKA